MTWLGRMHVGLVVHISSYLVILSLSLSVADYSCISSIYLLKNINRIRLDLILPLFSNTCPLFSIVHVQLCSCCVGGEAFGSQRYWRWNFPTVSRIFLESMFSSSEFISGAPPRNKLHVELQFTAVLIPVVGGCTSSRVRDETSSPYRWLAVSHFFIFTIWCISLEPETALRCVCIRAGGSSSSRLAGDVCQCWGVMLPTYASTEWTLCWSWGWLISSESGARRPPSRDRNRSTWPCLPVAVTSLGARGRLRVVDLMRCGEW